MALHFSFVEVAPNCGSSLININMIKAYGSQIAIFQRIMPARAGGD